MSRSSSGEERLTTHRHSVTALYNTQQRAVRQLTIGFLHQQEVLIASLNQKLAARKAQEEKQSSDIRSLEHQITDMEKELTASKEMMRVECETQNKLKEQLHVHVAKEALTHKKPSDDITTASKKNDRRFHTINKRVGPSQEGEGCFGQKIRNCQKEAWRDSVKPG